MLKEVRERSWLHGDQVQSRRHWENYSDQHYVPLDPPYHPQQMHSCSQETRPAVQDSSGDRACTQLPLEKTGYQMKDLFALDREAPGTDV